MYSFCLKYDDFTRESRIHFIMLSDSPWLLALSMSIEKASLDIRLSLFQKFISNGLIIHCLRSFVSFVNIKK